jgi:tetratricopeptide (TPR) repeat protein
MWRAEHGRSIVLSREAASLAGAVHEGFYELVTLCVLCNAHVGLGEWDAAFRVLDEVRHKSQERENKYGIARGTNTAGWLHHQLGDLRRAIELDREALDFSQAAKLGNPEIYSTINIAEDHFALGEVGIARGILVEAAERLRVGYFDSHRWKWQMRVALMLARVFQLEEDLDRAGTHLAEGLEIAERTESRRHLAEGYRIRGELWLAAGRTQDAEAELHRALEVAESTATPPTIWETAGALGRALGATNEAAARDAYRRALDVLHGALPRIPRPELQESLLRSEPVARLIEEAARLGLTLPTR